MPQLPREGIWGGGKGRNLNTVNCFEDFEGGVRAKGMVRQPKQRLPPAGSCFLGLEG